MYFTTVTDENGNDFHALMDNHKEDEAWVFFNKDSGFGNADGEFKLVRNLKKLDSGKYGA
jgi:hypothetical protein